MIQNFSQGGSSGLPILGRTVSFVVSNEIYFIASLPEGGVIPPLPPPASEGSFFTGWYTAATGGSAVTFPYTPPSDTTLYAHFSPNVIIGFSGLRNASGILTYTDDIASYGSYTTSESGDLVSVSSPLDSIFPFSEMREHTDEEGNVFVSIPKLWMSWSDHSSGAINGVKFANHQPENGNWFVPDAFATPENYSIYNDRFYLGKYEASGSTSKIYSKSGQNCLVSLTRSDFRTAARSYGNASNSYAGYQLLDFSMLVVYNFLAMLYFKTSDISSVWPGRSRDCAVYSSLSQTGECDGITSLCGWNKISGCVKMLGIENPYGNESKWIDGVNFIEEAVFCHRLPTTYSDTGGLDTCIDRPLVTGYVTALSHSPEPAPSYVYCTAGTGSTTIPSSYMNDLCSYSPDGTLLRAGGGYGALKSGGLWFLHGGGTATTISASTGARLALRDIVA